MGNKKEILEKAVKLIDYHRLGRLGGEVMPEDSNPHYPIGSKENYLYFTLPMALNYQRNAYKLWESAKSSAQDSFVADVFIPEKVLLMSEDELRAKLTKHKIALQKNKQPIIWQRLCSTFHEDFSGDVRNFFKKNDYSVAKIKEYMLANKKSFPYLSGNKIMNYWLYVMLQYTDVQFEDRWNISVAPDTNVIQGSVKLGLISEAEAKSSKVQQITAARWEEVFKETDYDPIDIHTPLWLWNRGDFPYSTDFFDL
ncbi:hypothetical protein [Candidatus Enterococcus clewellii]|uniref:Uncharacterized protein n=1 Tax=Candidatus Enterococcus clewellii TaxID=1834193 RepID=A0A242K1X7_9ENTE|nr:hypothetical protein [Enterococcus sp. 9E7_DIV0242]OTP11575.1 hypothetical protein A5888_003674 [Enterococcus sp. 9E7_DIV0242]